MELIIAMLLILIAVALIAGPETAASLVMLIVVAVLFCAVCLVALAILLIVTLGIASVFI